MGSAGSSSDWFAQHIACQCPIWKNFHLPCSHVISSRFALRLLTFRPGDKCVPAAAADPLVVKGRLHWPPQQGESVKSRPGWVNGHVPADGGRCWSRERSGLLFPAAQRWLRGHRGQHDPCDPHVTPLLQPQLLKVRKQLGFANISRNQNTRVPAPEKHFFLLLTAIHMYSDLQIVNIKKET